MTWSTQQIDNHRFAARLLDEIMNRVFLFIREKANHVTEKQVQRFIIDQFRINNLISDPDLPIVSFGKNTSMPHYFAENDAKLQKGDLIMIDIWARLKTPDAPFADITWMGFYGEKLNEKQQEYFDFVIEARDAAVSLIHDELSNKTLPSGKEIDDRVREIFTADHVEYFKHSTGHPLGFSSPHGRFGGGVSRKNPNKLHKGLGYTIEPGLYYNDEFGVRSEIDFYVSDEDKLIITTKVQKEIVLI